LVLLVITERGGMEGRGEDTMTPKITSNAYHLYELVMPPNGTTAKLLIDGVERISSYSGLNLIVNKPLIFFGATSSYATGNVNYNLVQFVYP
jgi:hypothetical protein